MSDADKHATHVKCPRHIKPNSCAWLNDLPCMCRLAAEAWAEVGAVVAERTPRFGYRPKE